jgi:benzoylformate decarboxylase
VIPNNRSYRILKERLVSFRRTDRFVGMDMRDPDIDFVALAQSLGVPATRVTEPGEIAAALGGIAGRRGPALIEIAVSDGFGA